MHRLTQRRSRSGRRIAAVALTVGMVVAACSGDGSDGVEVATVPATVDEPEVTPPTSLVDVDPPGVDTVAETTASSIGEVVDEVPVTETAPVISRPVFPDDICPAVSAQSFGPFDGGLTQVFFPMDEVFPIQIVGRIGTSPADPFALVQRVTNWNSGMRGEITQIGDRSVGISTYDNDNGEAIWLLDDGSTGYLRSRGLDSDEIAQIVETLAPRASDAAIPGFDVDSGASEFVLLQEQINADVRGTGGSSSECQVEATGYVYRLALVAGDPILQYAIVIDRPPPLDIGVIGDATIILTGVDDPHAPTLDHVIDADVERFEELLAMPGLVEQLATPPEVPIVVASGEDVELELVDATGVGPDSGPFLLQLVEELDPDTGAVAAIFLQVATSLITLHQDAVVEVTTINGATKSRISALVGPTHGIRISDGELPPPFDLSIRIVDGDPEDHAGDSDRILQVTPTIRLVPE